jgi:iron complex outermembrane receptor protein
VSIVSADSKTLHDSEQKSDYHLNLDDFSFADGDPDAMFFQEIPSVVTPSRMEQKPWHSPSTVTVITEEKIRKWGVRSVADLLRHVGGVNVRQYGINHLAAPRGGNNDIYIFNMLVLLDGIPVNDPILGKFDLGPDFPVEMLKKVEVVRGPGSSLYGANAYSGIINLVTREPADISANRMDTQFGPDGYLKFTFETGKSFLDEGWILGGRYFDTEARDRHVINDNDAFNDLDFWGKYSSKKVGCFIKASNMKQGRPLDMNDGDEDDYVEDDSVLFNGKYNFFDTPDSSLTAKIYANSINGSYPLNSALGTRVPFDTSRIGASLQLTRVLPDDQTLIAGMEWADKSGEWADLGGKRTSHESAFFIQDEIAKLKDWTFTIGGRLDYDSQFGATGSPRFSAIYALDSKKSLRFSAGRAYRAPTFSEQYIEAWIGYPYKAIGDPDIEPEFVTSYEIGFEHRVSSRLMYGLVVYHNLQSNMISLVPSMDVDSLGNPFVRITPTNLSASTAHGIELDLTTQISARGSLNLNYTFEEVTDDESNESLNYVPKHQGNLNFEYDFSDKFTSAILFHVQSESLGNFTNSLSGFGTIDARFAFEVEKGTTISLSGYNLTDKYYFETENYPMPGRTILTEVSIRF